MERYENIRLSDGFINFTDQTVRVYEKNSGAIYIFPPQTRRELPSLPKLASGKPIVHFILDTRFIQFLDALGRPLDDIVNISSESYGRNHIKITYLAWAKDPGVDVCLYKNAYQANFVHK